MPRKLKFIPQRYRWGGRQKGESEDTLHLEVLLEHCCRAIEYIWKSHASNPTSRRLKTILAVRLWAAHAVACWSHRGCWGSHKNAGSHAKWGHCRCSLVSLLFKKTEFGINRLLLRLEYKPREPDVVIGSSSQWVLKTVERLTTCVCNNLKIFYLWNYDGFYYLSGC